jgi:uncharacterized protein YcbK (DUF882 family)
MVATAGLVPARAVPTPRELRFYHTHTGERLSIVHRDANGYLTEALAELTRFLADFRTGELKPIDPALFDILEGLQPLTRSNGTWEIISGYRSPQTNAALRSHSRGVAERSLHMDGKALDLRLTGVELAHLRDAAWSLQEGGVGYYPASNFIHVDTGRVRRW